MVRKRWPRVTLPVPTDAVLLGVSGAVQVVGIDEQGRYVLEDMHTEVYMDENGRRQIRERRVRVSPAELVRDYRVAHLPTVSLEEEIAHAA